MGEGETVLEWVDGLPDDREDDPDPGVGSAVPEDDGRPKSDGPSGGRRGGRPADGFRLTGTDVYLLTWLARHRFASPYQAADKMGVHWRTAYWRARRLERAGLLRRQAVSVGYGSVLMPTASGVAVCHSPHQQSVFAWAVFEHTLGLVDLSLRYDEKVGAVGPDGVGEDSDVVTEREMYAADLSPGRDPGPFRYVVGKEGASGEGTHMPDLFVAPADGSPGEAVELELNAKKPQEWRRVLLGYAAAPHVATVTYYTPEMSIAQGVKRVGDELELGDMLRVLGWQRRGADRVPAGGDGD